MEKTKLKTEAVIIRKSIKGNPILGFGAAGNTVFGGDPAPLVDGDTVYIYVGQDESYNNFYRMPRWLVYSSKDMVNWVYESIAMEENTKTIPWANSSVTAWAAQVIKHNGRYYLYYCTTSEHADGQHCIGVAVADSPTGPFTDSGSPLVNSAELGLKTSEKSWYTIDPTVWIDRDENGEEHRYLSFGNTYNVMCELNDDMVSIKDIDGDGLITRADFVDTVFTNMTDKDGNRVTFTEAAWLYRRQDENGSYYGKYYMFFADGWRESISYAVTDDIMSGRWEHQGLFMDVNATSNTSHGGIIDFKGKTYYVYHNGALPGGSGFRRVVNIREFRFNADGSIDTIEELSTGIDGWSAAVISADGSYLGHEQFRNTREDSGYPLSYPVTAGDPDGYNTQWEIKPGKADTEDQTYVSLQSVNKPGLYICVKNNDIVLTQDHEANLYEAMTFRTIKALCGDPSMVSFESVLKRGSFLTVSAGRLTLSVDPDANTASFRIEPENEAV